MKQFQSNATMSIKISEYTLIADQDTVNFILSKKVGYENGKDGNVFYFRTLLVKYKRDGYKEILGFFNNPATDLHFVKLL